MKHPKQHPTCGVKTHPKIGEPFVIGSQYSMERAVDVVMATNGDGGCGVFGSMDAVRTVAELETGHVEQVVGVVGFATEKWHRSATRVEQECNKSGTK